MRRSEVTRARLVRHLVDAAEASQEHAESLREEMSQEAAEARAYLGHDRLQACGLADLLMSHAKSWGYTAKPMTEEEVERLISELAKAGDLSWSMRIMLVVGGICTCTGFTALVRWLAGA